MYVKVAALCAVLLPKAKPAKCKDYYVITVKSTRKNMLTNPDILDIIKSTVKTQYT